MNENQNKDLFKKNISTDNPEQLGKRANSKIWGYLLAIILIALVILAIIFFIQPKPKTPAPTTQTGQVAGSMETDRKMIKRNPLFRLQEGALLAGIDGFKFCVFIDQDSLTRKDQESAVACSPTVQGLGFLMQREELEAHIGEPLCWRAANVIDSEIGPFSETCKPFMLIGDIDGDKDEDKTAQQEEQKDQEKATIEDVSERCGNGLTLVAETPDGLQCYSLSTTDQVGEWITL